jgi:hypothetical protein
MVRQGHANLWELPSAGGTARQLTTGIGNDVSPDVSPDGRTLSFVTNTFVTPIYRAPLDSRSRATAITTLEETTSHLAVTPDGADVIAEADRDGKHFVIAAATDGKGERVLAEGSVPALTLDGREIVFAAPGQPATLTVLTRATGATRRLVELAGELEHVTPGPDGELHLRLHRASGIEAWRVPLAGGPLERDAPAPFCMLAPAPQGGLRIGVVCGYDGDELHVYGPGEPLNPKSPPEVAHAVFLAWYPTGDGFLYLDARRRVAGRTLPAHKARLYSQADSQDSAAISPDGRVEYVSTPELRSRRRLLVNFGDRPSLR